MNPENLARMHIIMLDGARQGTISYYRYADWCKAWGFTPDPGVTPEPEPEQPQPPTIAPAPPPGYRAPKKRKPRKPRPKPITSTEPPANTWWID